MKKVAFVTTVFDPSMEFSVTKCTETLVLMLIEHGYSPVRVITQEGMPFLANADSEPVEKIAPFVELEAPSI